MAGGLRSLPRRSWLAATAAICATGLLAAPATAATTIGQTVPTPSKCGGPDAGQVQDQVAAPPDYIVPSDGVITSFSATAPLPTQGAQTQTRLLILQRVSRTRFTVLAKSESGAFTAPLTVQTFPTRIPVRAGQLIGNYGEVCEIKTGNPRDVVATFKGGDPATGVDQNFPGNALDAPSIGFRADLSASLEADCDQDGLGDETEDNNTSPCPTCKGQTATIIGKSGNDVRSGTPGKDVIVGLGGKDKLSGLAGNDLICGGNGKDALNGGKGNDKLFGQQGKDTLRGGAGKDKQIQ